jgi:predicted DNA-binding transcriptional regulator AlpA
LLSKRLESLGSRLGRSHASWSLSAVLDWLRMAPAGTMVDAAAIREALEGAGEGPAPAPVLPLPHLEPPWRERLWTAPPETRVGVRELAEAVGRPRSWVYRRTGQNGKKALLPHRKLDGELVFVVGEIRDWLREHEVEVVPPLSMFPARHG